MKNLITLLLVLAMGTSYAQDDFKYLNEVEIETKLVGDEVTLDFKKTFVANIVLSDDEGGILEKYTNYMTNKDLSLKPAKYGSGTYYVYIQLNDMIAIKRITVKPVGIEGFKTYNDTYKIIIK